MGGWEVDMDWVVGRGYGLGGWEGIVENLDFREVDSEVLVFGGYGLGGWKCNSEVCY